MRIRTLILTIIAATLLMAPASPQDRVNLPRKERIEESDKKVKELQKERIATLQEMVIQTTRLFQRGQGSFEEVLEANLLVFKAELDAAEKESDRITIYKNIVDFLKKLETAADQRWKAARGSQASLLKVKARRLKAEIDLERAKAKEAKETR
jgi:outer membrane protein TolC